MAHGVLIENAVMAKNIDSLNRSFKSASDLDSGNVIRLDTIGTDGEREVWVGTAPSTGSLNGLWMVGEPEVNRTVDGTSIYLGLNPDPRNFYFVAGQIGSAFKMQPGDIVTLTADNLAGTKSTNTFVNASDGSLKLTWGATATADALSLKLREETYISIPSGSIGTQRVTAYRFECVAN